jgi:membrane protein implicated in regulation of membrane protease activity
MEFTPIELWLAVGIIFILVEFTSLPGIGLLFLGLGAISTSILIYYVPEIQNYQVASVGLSSLAWFLVLWWPLKIFVYGKKGDVGTDYFDMVGMQVEVAVEDIKPSGSGQVYWSGTLMNARLEDKDSAAAKIGDKLYVTKIKGNILICSRKKP